MGTSSTMTRSMGSGERKRCSNMAPVRRLRSLAWMNARRLPGVRCSTLKTVCSSLLCLMIMPGRICVAGIAIKEKLLHFLLNCCDRSKVDCSPFFTCRRFWQRSDQCDGRRRLLLCLRPLPALRARTRLLAQGLAAERARRQRAGTQEQVAQKERAQDSLRYRSGEPSPGHASPRMGPRARYAEREAPLVPRFPLLGKLCPREWTKDHRPGVLEPRGWMMWFRYWPPKWPAWLGIRKVPVHDPPPRAGYRARS